MTWKARVKFQTLGFSKLRAGTRRCGQDWPLACSPRPFLCRWLCPQLEGTGACVDTCHHTFVSAQCWLCTPLASRPRKADLRKTPKKQTWGHPRRTAGDPRTWKQVPDTESKWACSTGPTDSSLNGRACSEEGQGGTLVCAWFYSVLLKMQRMV